MSDLLTPTDVAAKIGGDISAERVIRLCRERNWPHVRMGRAVRFTPDQYERIVAMQSVEVRTGKAPAIPGQTKRSAGRSS